MYYRIGLLNGSRKRFSALRRQAAENLRSRAEKANGRPVRQTMGRGRNGHVMWHCGHVTRVVCVSRTPDWGEVGCCLQVQTTAMVCVLALVSVGASIYYVNGSPLFFSDRPGTAGKLPRACALPHCLQCTLNTFVSWQVCPSLLHLP